MRKRPAHPRCDVSFRTCELPGDLPCRCTSRPILMRSSRQGRCEATQPHVAQKWCHFTVLPCFTNLRKNPTTWSTCEKDCDKTFQSKSRNSPKSSMAKWCGQSRFCRAFWADWQSCFLNSNRTHEWTTGWNDKSHQCKASFRNSSQGSYSE